VEAAIWKSRLKNWLWMESENIKAMEFFKEKGIEIVQVDDASVKTMMKWADEYIAELAAKDEFFKKVADSQAAWGKKWYPYTKSFSLPH
jgi:TRAP-type mannitol/chloroaromatic compound transport system substrate-binding protein